MSYPVLLHTVIDARDCRGLAEFYRELFGLHYRQGEEPPTDGSHDDADWLVLLDDNGSRVVTVQRRGTPFPRPGRQRTSRCRCTWTSRSPLSRNWSGIANMPRSWVLGCFTTAHRTRANPSMSLPIRLAIRSACWSSRTRSTYSSAAGSAMARTVRWGQLHPSLWGQVGLTRPIRPGSAGMPLVEWLEGDPD